MRHLIVLTTLLIVLTGCVTRPPPVPREDAELAVWGLVLPDELLSRRYVLDARTLFLGSPEVSARLPRLEGGTRDRRTREALVDFEDANARAEVIRRAPHAMALAAPGAAGFPGSHPEAWALVRVTRVGFDRDRSTAVFYANVRGRDGSGAAHLIVARRKGDVWSVDSTY